MRLFASCFFLVLLFLGSGSINADGITSIAKTNKLLTQAESAMKKKNFRTAVSAYEEALKESSEVPPHASLNLGHAYFELKDFPKARKNYLAAAANLSSPSLKSVAYQQIGNIFSAEKNYKSAAEWYKKSLKTDPENQSARFNYELAYKLQLQKEKQDAASSPQKNPEKDSGDPQIQKKEKEGGQNSSQKNPKNTGEEEKKGREKNPDPKSGSPQNKKSPQGQESKQGQEKPGESKSETDKKQEGGEQETPDEDGKDVSRNKNQETNLDDPDAQRMDRKKLQEAGLTEEQAKSMLQAMRQHEVKYLQQRRFKRQKGGSDKDKPKW